MSISPSHLSQPHPLREPVFRSSLPHPPTPLILRSAHILYYSVLSPDPHISVTIVPVVKVLVSLFRPSSVVLAASLKIFKTAPPPAARRPQRNLGPQAPSRAPWPPAAALGGGVRGARGRAAPPAPGSARAVQAGGTWPLPVSLPGRRGPELGPCPSHPALSSSRRAAAAVAAGFSSRCPRAAPWRRARVARALAPSQQ